MKCFSGIAHKNAKAAKLPTDTERWMDTQAASGVLQWVVGRERRMFAAWRGWGDCLLPGRDKSAAMMMMMMMTTRRAS